MSGAFSGALNAAIYGQSIKDGFIQGAKAGAITGAMIGAYRARATENFIAENVNCGSSGCTEAQLNAIWGAGQSPAGSRLMSKFRDSGAILNLRPESSSPAASSNLGPHVIRGTNDMYFDGNVQNDMLGTGANQMRFGDLVAYETWGPSMDDATTFVHELGHTVSALNFDDPKNVAYSENLYRTWMGTPHRNDYSILNNPMVNQFSNPVPTRSFWDFITQTY